MTSPRLLVTNDDGHQAPGLKALVDAVAPFGEVWVVAPESEQSAASHAISLQRPLRIREVGPRWYAVDGTPTDCSYVAINHLLKDHRPALVVSGINRGPNLADDVFYSGTVAAAMEAAIFGVPAIAFSLAGRGDHDFAPAARFARRLVEAALGEALPRDLLLNVNIPADIEPDTYVVTRLGRHRYATEVVEKVDPRGRKYYWIGGSEYDYEGIPGTDCYVVFHERRVSVTPLQRDLTDYRLRPEVARWQVKGCTRIEQG